MSAATIPPEIQSRLDAQLSTQGLRRTRQRDLIFHTIFTSQDHFTADELWERTRRIDRTASRATVYRTLALLVEGGLLGTLDFGRDQTIYDPNFINHPHHSHLICLDCSKVVEFEDAHMNVLEDCISRRLGFRPASKSLRIEANCEELRATGLCRQRFVPATV